MKCAQEHKRNVRATGDLCSSYAQNLEIYFLDLRFTKCVISNLNSSICSALKHVPAFQRMFKTPLLVKTPWAKYTKDTSLVVRVL